MAKTKETKPEIDLKEEIYKLLKGNPKVQHETTVKWLEIFDKEGR